MGDRSPPFGMKVSMNSLQPASGSLRSVRRDRRLCRGGRCCRRLILKCQRRSYESFLYVLLDLESSPRFGQDDLLRDRSSRIRIGISPLSRNCEEFNELEIAERYKHPYPYGNQIPPGPP